MSGSASSERQADPEERDDGGRPDGQHGACAVSWRAPSGGRRGWRGTPDPSRPPSRRATRTAYSPDSTGGSTVRASGMSMLVTTSRAEVAVALCSTLRTQVLRRRRACTRAAAPGTKARETEAVTHAATTVTPMTPETPSPAQRGAGAGEEAPRGHDDEDDAERAEALPAEQAPLGGEGEVRRQHPGGDEHGGQDAAEVERGRDERAGEQHEPGDGEAEHRPVATADASVASREGTTPSPPRRGRWRRAGPRPAAAPGRGPPR